MYNITTGILLECWGILKEAAPYVIFGFFAAGILKAVIPEDLVAKHLGQNGTRSVLKASLFGIPLPLCSCGVIPVAIGLRKQGASKGATASFLVSVPETGVDSVAITWALLDPLMTIVRPIAAFITAVVTGMFINLIPDTKEIQSRSPQNGCGCSSHSKNEAEDFPHKESLKSRIEKGLIYAFSDLLKDIGGWLMLGIAIAGIISFFVPVGFIEQYLGGEYSSLLIMLVIGIPLYICASASTPIAAALVLKGLSPGAALVFLLAGPATNAATMTVVAKHLGKTATVVYATAIAICSLAMGWVVNRIYAWADIDVMTWVKHAEHTTESLLYPASAILLLALLLRNYLPEKKSDGPGCGCHEQPGGG
jgi:uncharacterized membrane protein YraQ (UPF0718 family)